MLSLKKFRTQSCWLVKRRIQWVIGACVASDHVSPVFFFELSFGVTVSLRNRQEIHVTCESPTQMPNSQFNSNKLVITPFRFWVWFLLLARFLGFYFHWLCFFSFLFYPPFSLIDIFLPFFIGLFRRGIQDLATGENDAGVGERLISLSSVEQLQSSKCVWRSNIGRNYCIVNVAMFWPLSDTVPVLITWSVPIYPPTGYRFHFPTGR